MRLNNLTLIYIELFSRTLLWVKVKKEKILLTVLRLYSTSLQRSFIEQKTNSPSQTRQKITYKTHMKHQTYFPLRGNHFPSFSFARRLTTKNTVPNRTNRKFAHPLVQNWVVKSNFDCFSYHTPWPITFNCDSACLWGIKDPPALHPMLSQGRGVSPAIF